MSVFGNVVRRADGDEGRMEDNDILYPEDYGEPKVIIDRLSSDRFQIMSVLGTPYLMVVPKRNSGKHKTRIKFKCGDSVERFGTQFKENGRIVYYIMYNRPGDYNPLFNEEGKKVTIAGLTSDAKRFIELLDKTDSMM